MEEINARYLKNYLYYVDDIEILITDKCPRGNMFLLRKAHLSKYYKTSFGSDVLIVNNVDFSGCYVEK